MKQFRFPLDRVLDYRRVQVRIEEAKLEQLNGELQAVKAQETAVRSSQEEARYAIVRASSATSQELASLERHTVASRRRSALLQRAHLEVNQRIAQQMEALAARRREMRLLEKLRERRLAEWTRAFQKETEQQAEEAFLARWNRTQ